MSQRPSACIPPPSDYAPKPRLNNGPAHSRSRQNSERYRSRPGCHEYRNSGKLSFESDKQNHDEARQKQQPKDRFHRNDDDDYFARVQDAEDDKIEDCNRTVQSEISEVKSIDEEEDDPLDAYMKSLEEGDTSTNKVHPTPQTSSLLATGEDDLNLKTNVGHEVEPARGVRLDIDGTDDIEESYYKYVEEKKNQTENLDDDDNKQDLIEYDKDGNIIGTRKVKREIEPLPPVDHSNITYEEFKKVFYQEHDEISKLTSKESDDLRAKLEIKVSGRAPPKPVCSFAHFKFDEKLMRIIRKSEYYQPTPIQAQAIPAALLGRNIIGIATTGSGKTAAYIWPMIVHIINQPNLKKGDGPIGLVLVPTRELALQVHGEARKFSNSHKLRVVCAYGGGSRYEQTKDLEVGAEIVIATPGRIIDLIKTGATNLRRVTYLVLDEADRFFEMGFEIQVRSICDQIRPDRQILLFSATFKHRVEQLARTVTDDPVKIIQKSLGEANEDVTQHTVIFRDVAKKYDWLMNSFVKFTSSGSVLIFVTRILSSEELHKKLTESGKQTLLLHGDMDQSERNRVITAFKRKDLDVMIATDVAARGLDISHIRTVINYDVARDIDTHIHRIGRTGRAGSKGDAYTLLSVEKDKEFAAHLVKNLESSNQKVDEELLQLAMRSQVFRKTRKDRDRRHSQPSSSQHKQGHHHHGYNSFSDHGRRNYGDYRSSLDRHDYKRKNYSNHHQHSKRSEESRSQVSHGQHSHDDHINRGPDRSYPDLDRKRMKSYQ